MKKKNHIVFTTINYPLVIKELFDNINKYDHIDEVKVWIVGDCKTPPGLFDLSKEFSRKGLEIVYLDIDAQDKWGKRCADFYDRVPYNNETRRNIGYLCALEDECEVLISIDDDNFPTDDDFVGAHSQTGSWFSEAILRDKGGFHNICEYLSFEPSRQVFPRGYPFELRSKRNNPQYVKSDGMVRIGVTAGLWLKDPDIDATTWLNGRITSKSYNSPERIVLEQSTWTPINTQNTSIVKELVPAFFCVPMGWDVPGGKIQRYGDIWGGYFLQALMEGTAYHVSFGRPIVEHRRNPHNYVDDMRSEFWGMILTDWLLAVLRENFKPSGTLITERIKELAVFIEDKAIEKMPSWCPDQVRDFMRWTAGTLHAWALVCETIAPNEPVASLSVSPTANNSI